jgi:DNA-binding protein HU-beta
MNVSDLVDAAVTAEPKLTKSQAKAIIDGVFKALTEAAVKGEDVAIPGFGKFKVQAKPARTGRNPATGGTIEIAASRKVAFTPAKQLKDAMNG